MKLTKQYLLAITAVATLILPMLAATPDSDAKRRKAQYALYEAIAKKDAGDLDAANALMRHAYSLDPDDPTISFYTGYCGLAQQDISLQEIDTLLALMRVNTFKREDNFHENYLYANICAQTGHQDEAIRVMETLLRNNPSKTELYSDLAKTYAATGRLDKAIAAVDSLERHEGRNITTALTKIGYMINSGDTVGSLREGREYLRQAPGSVESQMLMGSILQQFGQNDSAFFYYDRALAIDPDYGYANFQKAQLYNRLGDSIGFEREIRATLMNKNIEVDMKNDILTDYVRTCILAGDSSNRVDNMFKVILSQHPHEAQFRKLYSDYLSFMGNYERASEQLSYSLDINPADSKSWERLMWLYIFLKHPEKAIETGHRALEYLPDEIGYYQILGSAYYQTKDYQKSIQAYDTLLARNKDLQMVNDAEIYAAMAESYHQTGDDEQTLDCYRKALAIDPDNALALNNYAYFLCVNSPDSLDEAERMSRLALVQEDGNASYLDTYAWIMFLRHDYQKALEYIEKAAEKCDPSANNHELWEHYGDILFMLGRPDEALEKWKDALGDDPSSTLLKKKIDNKAFFYE